MTFHYHDRHAITTRLFTGRGCLAALLLILAHLTAWSQQPQLSTIRDTALAKSNTPPEVLQGTAKFMHAYEPTSKLRVAIGLKPPHMAAEEKFLQELQDKDSPNFHKYLSPEQWNARFAPSAKDEQAVVDWATSQGLTITARYPNRLMVNVEGTVESIQKALGVTINNYEVDGAVEFSNDRDPVIPANLIGIIGSFDGLNSIQRMRSALTGAKAHRGPDYSPGPMRQDGPEVPHMNATKPAPKTLTASEKATGANGEGAVTGGNFDPTDIYSSDMYDFNALAAQGHCCNPFHTSGYEGGAPAVASIGLVNDGDLANSDIIGFYNAYPYLAGFPHRVWVGGTPYCCDVETTLDMDWAIATSNSFGSEFDTAQVFTYEAAQGFGDFGAVYEQMLTDNLVRVVNISYQCAEYTCISSDLMDSWHGMFNQMIGQGWTIVVAAGDNGASMGCGDYIDVSYPGTDPDVVSVGGTKLTLNSDGTFNQEVTWTGDTEAGACASNNGGTGGGCSYKWAAPGYQTSPACGSGSRSVPDIALNASGHSRQNFFFDGSLSGEGGTSIAAPEVSGFMAQENAYLLAIGVGCGSGYGSECAPVGEVNYSIYREGYNPTYAPHSPFYDITSGCNSNDITNLYGLGSYCAGTGYDLTTGWGSFNALQLSWAISTYYAGSFANPTVTFSGPFSGDGAVHWYNTDKTVSWTVAANGNGTYPATGVAGYSAGWDTYFSDPDSEPSPGSGNSFYSGPEFPNSTSGSLDLASAGQGCHYATVDAWDNTGFTSGNDYYYYICYDTIAPKVSATNSPAANSYGYNKQTVGVTLTATDPGTAPSGIKTTYYGLNKLCNNSNLGACSVYSGPISVTGAGYNYVAYFTEDVAGNVSAVSYDYIYIDEVPPVTTATLAGTKEGSNTNYDTVVKVTLSATDNYSGVLETHYSIDGGSTVTYSAPFSITALGSHTVKYYSVDRAGNTEATKAVTFTITSLTTTVLTASPNPSVTGKTVTLTAKVTASLSGTPTGTVTFKNGSTTLGTETLSGGEASFTTASLPTGSDYLKAIYNGATTFLTSTSATVTEDVEQTTKTTVTSSANPSVFGKSVTFTAKVTPSGSGSPNGSVKFLDGATVLATETLPSTGGVVTFSTAALSAGTHSITAVYEGSSTYAGSTSAVLTETVERAKTTTKLYASPNPAKDGQLVTFTAVVTPAYTGTPSGSVTFSDGSKVIGTVTLTGGDAKLDLSNLSVGTHSVTAAYNGNSDYLTSKSAAVSEVIQ
jgi:hypothetical protein